MSSKSTQKAKKSAGLDRWKRLGQKLKHFVVQNHKIIILVVGVTIFSAMLLANKLHERGYSLHSKHAFLAFGLLLLVTAVVVGVLYWAKKKAWKIEKIYLVCGMMMGVFYCFALPLSTVPDEPMHFWRAYELSEGKLVQDAEGNIYGPETLKLAIDTYYGGKAGYAEELKRIDMSAEGAEIVPINGSADTYMPFNYVPQVAGIWIGKIFQMPFIPMMYVSRLLNMICCVLVVFLCIKYIPAMKKLVFLVGMLPMAMQQFASVSADGSIICAGMALITYVLYARKGMKRQIGVWDFLLLLVTCLVLTVTKPVYAFLCLIVFWIPKERFKDTNWRKLLFIGLLGAATLAMMLVKMMVFPGDGGRFSASDAQIAFIVQEPLNFLWIAFRNIIGSVVVQIGGMIGLELEAFTVEIYLPYVVTLFVLFVLLCAERDSKLPASLRLFAFWSSIAMVIAVYASLFAIYSVPGLDIIEGVQGRYFLPFLLLVPMIFLPSEGSKGLSRREILKPSYLYATTLLINVYVVMVIFSTHMG